LIVLADPQLEHVQRGSNRAEYNRMRTTSRRGEDTNTNTTTNTTTTTNLHLRLHLSLIQLSSLPKHKMQEMLSWAQRNKKSKERGRESDRESDRERDKEQEKRRKAHGTLV